MASISSPTGSDTWTLDLEVSPKAHVQPWPITLRLASTVWREVRPEDGMVNVATSVKLQRRLESNLCGHVS